MQLYSPAKSVVYYYFSAIRSCSLDVGDVENAISLERFFSPEIQKGLYLHSLTVDHPKYVDEFIE
jgi:hypothetical protein